MVGKVTKLHSIQGEQQKETRHWGNVKCRAFQKHGLDGHVYRERLAKSRKIVWVARLECDSCGTHRVDVMQPKTCELISRLYIHPDGYDGKLSPAEARKMIYKYMVENEVSFKDVG